jgi:superfamily II DNA or RNA helicase
VSALRCYQLRAVEAVRDAFGRVKRVLLVLPTGAGKTHTAAALIARAHARGKRCLFLVHRREIVLDTARRLAAAGIPCGVVMAGQPTTEAPVQVASVQTIAARELAPPADLLIWDEAHHVAADTWRAIAAQYPAAYHLGLSATPVRSDGQGLRDAFDELVVGSTIAELVGLGVLAPVDVVGPARRQSALSMAPFEAWQQHAGGRPTVAFCATIAESRALVAALAEQGVAAAHVDGDTSRRRRDAILEDFAAGRLDVVSNVAVLTEGWDCARAEVILLARGCDSPGTLLQTIGRGRRYGADPSKRCLLVDLCGAVHQHGMPDSERDWTLDGLRAPAKGSADAIRQCPECGAVYLVAEHPRACPAGHVPPPQPEREVKPAPVSFITSTVPRAELQAEFDRLSQLARERRWKPNAVPVLFKQRFGFWPARMRETRRVA